MGRARAVNIMTPIPSRRRCRRRLPARLTTRLPLGAAALAGLLFLSLAGVHGLGAQEPPDAPGYFRWPAIHGETVVFTAEGDLWSVPVTGGVARRLTSHPGAEDHARISPDGKWIAFSAEYDGPVEAYVMPADGGLPRRLTWDGEGATVAGWSPDGRVAVATRAWSTLPNEQIGLLDPATLDLRRVPLAQAAEVAWGEVEPGAGATLFFTRLPFQGSSTRFYTGGTVQQVWRLAPDAPEAVNLTGDWRGTSKNPLWLGGRLYFLSDRQHETMNLWSMLPDGSDARAHTAHTDFEIRAADAHGRRLVYQRDGRLHLFDAEARMDEVIDIRLPSDFDQTRERWVAKPMDFLTDARPSPDGKKIVLTARGRLFVAPVAPVADGGRLVAVPEAPGVRLRAGQFWPHDDGASLLAVSDETGELEFVTRPADGLTPGARLTTDGRIFRFTPAPSPDGAWLAWQDKDQCLWVRQVRSDTPIKVAESIFDEFRGLVWSPDSQWLAYVESSPNTYSQLKLFRPIDGARHTLTTDRTNADSPCWSADGQWLYFLSDRALRSLVRSPWGPRQPEPFFTEVTRLYAIALKKGVRPPWLPPVEEAPPAEQPENKASLTPDKDKDKDKDKDSGSSDAPTGRKAAKKDPPNVVIDPDGLAARLWELPVPAGNWSRLDAAEKHLLFTETPARFDAKSHLRRWEIKPGAEVQTVADDVKSWELCANRRKVLIRTQKDQFHVIDPAGDAPAKLEKPVPLDAWSFTLSPRDEWRTIYNEAWRMLRDFFYDPALHGFDWDAVRRKYEARIDRLADRHDLTDLLQEMAGELQALHIYVRHGDRREGPDQARPAQLGARLERDPAAGGWRIAHVYQTDPEFPAGLSPLARPGIDVGPGAVLLSINGQRTLDAPHPHALLRQQAGRPVLLGIREGQNERRVTAMPLDPGQAADLRYDEWEHTRRLEVERLGNRQIGYVHLRAMGGDNIAEWAREFYPVFDRPGLIIDVRHNRGGNIDSWLLGRLLRKAWMYWSDRRSLPTWNMQYAFRGHVTVLCNEFTASDGEAFAEGFKRLGLGKTIGTRTWGGEIWLNARRWLVDRGMCTAAEMGVYGPEGAWLIEQHGVEPDIVVDNPPVATFNGQDAQLEAAVTHLLDLIKQDPRPVPAVPAKPRKR